ncbi:MAG: alpha/beta fold hydrolase [Spirochaetes bacterium]|nr:alpha/beta fold hydrolase [Spirochaetota bacterium]
MNEKFIPKFFARSPLFQTVYGSLKLKKNDSHPVFKTAEKIIVNGCNGEKLLCYYSGQPDGNPAGTVLLIHGWEGSSDSSYIKSAAKYLFNKGYNIFRLNLRDHGDSHHLNEGIFKSTLIDETFTAVCEVASFKKNLPFFIAGYSLGGNFALRIALRGTKIKNLKHVVAVSPVIDPAASTKATDKTGIIRYYFLKKWKRSMEKKQNLFPDLYDFTAVLDLKSIWEMTEKVITEHSEFSSNEEYFSKYTLTGNTFKNLKTPTTIITSIDDPIIPVDDFYELKSNGKLEIIIQPYGGHNGFFDFFPSIVWYHEKMARIFNQY